jgi:hypothetical protein
VIAESLIAHGVGDYLIQSHWMATEKTKRWLPAVLHAATYGLPFLVLTRSPLALLIISGTHAVIDRYRLARHVVWLKNQMGPKAHRPQWADAKATGYPSDTPPWLAVWLMILADNLIHILINAAALTWLT